MKNIAIKLGILALGVTLLAGCTLSKQNTQKNITSDSETSTDLKKTSEDDIKEMDGLVDDLDKLDISDDDMKDL